jgi:hypothetical protein
MPWSARTTRLADSVVVLGGAGAGRLVHIRWIVHRTRTTSRDDDSQDSGCNKLFMSSLSNLFAENQAVAFLAVQNDAPNLSYWGGSVRLGPKGGKQRARGSRALAKVK